MNVVRSCDYVKEAWKALCCYARVFVFFFCAWWRGVCFFSSSHMPSGLYSTMASLPNWESCSNSWAVSSHPFTCPLSLSPTSEVAMQAYLLVAMFSCSLLRCKKKLCLWNARFHLALSFCAPLPCHILPHKLSVLFTITPFFPLRTMYVFSSPHPFLSVHPFVCCSLWHLCHARLWGREGGTGLTIVTGQTHEISIVLFLSRCTVLASNLWWCQAPPFFVPFIWFYGGLWSSAQETVQNCIGRVTHQALHQFSFNRTGFMWLSTTRSI